MNTLLMLLISEFDSVIVAIAVFKYAVDVENPSG